jgi:hypothetical protein
MHASHTSIKAKYAALATAASMLHHAKMPLSATMIYHPQI